MTRIKKLLESLSISENDPWWKNINSFADMEKHVKSVKEPERARQDTEFKHYRENPTADRPSHVPQNAERVEMPGYGHRWQWTEDGMLKHCNVKDPNASYRRRKNESLPLADYLLHLFEQA